MAITTRRLALVPSSALATAALLPVTASAADASAERGTGP